MMKSSLLIQKLQLHEKNTIITNNKHINYGTYNIYIGAYILIPILAAVLGGWVSAFFGNKYQKAQEDKKMMEVRNIAIKALDIVWLDWS